MQVMRQTIQHTLWVFDAGARDFRSKTIPEAIGLLNALFLPNCVGDVGVNFTINSAVATPVAGGPIAPGRFDAVVFLVRDVSHSLSAKIGAKLSANAQNNNMVLGSTFIGHPAGGLAEVFWDRCFNNNEAAGAIFHEAAHLKSGLADKMHTATVGAPHGGSGLKVLSAIGGKHAIPSYDDLEFYSNAITNQITVRTQIP